MMGDQTLEPYAIPIPPQLAGRLKQALGRTGTGFDEGAFLQQLHYWTRNAATTGWMIDGIKWVYNSLKSWQAQFPWMSEYGLRKAIANLKKLGLIQTAQHWLSQYRRVMFYRIDYDQLAVFAADVCDQFTARCVASDHLDVRSVHITDPDISSETSFSEPQTGVVAKMNESREAMDAVSPQRCHQAAEGEVGTLGGDTLAPASSGNKSPDSSSKFPELMAAAVEVIGQLPPPSLQHAIAQFPARVKPAIAYLQHQQQKRKIQNPIGYLYTAIIQAWELTIPAAIVPVGFKEWFDGAKAKGEVVAAMAIDGVHYTLHLEQGWVPTVTLMRQY